MSRKTREHGMSWEEVQEYDGVIQAIAHKYAGDRTLAEDVAQEVRLKLHTDKTLDISKFNPDKKDAAIRNTIRNKALKVLQSRKLGRWQFESLDTLTELGVQVDSYNNVLYPRNNSAFNPMVDKDITADGETP